MKKHYLNLAGTLLAALWGLSLQAQSANQSAVCSLTVSIAVTDASAPQAHDGSVTANAANGTTPYTYYWNTTETTVSLTGLGTGRHYVTVTDAAGCTATATARVSAPGCDSFSVGIGYESTQSNSLNVHVFIITGTAPYTYQWSTGATDSAIYNQPSGIYCVTVTDAIGCSATPCAGEGQPPSGITPTEDIGQLSIYPNPASNVLTINLAEQESATLSLTAIDGREILSARLTRGLNNIYTQGLPTGMYGYTITAANRLKQKRGKVMVVE